MKIESKKIGKTKAYLTVYRFMYPEHYNYLMTRGIGVRWMPDWSVSLSSIKYFNQ